MTETTDSCSCGGTGKVLMFYSRGPNSPPGNTYVGCPNCDAGRAYDAAIKDEFSNLQERQP